MALDFFYDAQIRKYVQQFVRIFSGFQYKTGKTRDGEEKYRTIPARMSSSNRLVANILRNNSENTILSAPFITCWIQSVEIDRSRTQTPTHVGKLFPTERKIDPETGEYTSEPGNYYTVERYMPVPYNLTMQTDIWTTNEVQKHQILEQILVLFNPSIDIQSNTNPLDWSSLTIVELTGINWTSRNVQVGSESELEITTLTFKVPIWINPPAKIKKQTLIHQIITNILDGDTTRGPVDETGNAQEYYFSESDLMTRIITSPGDFKIGIERNIITLLDQRDSNIDPRGNEYSWKTLLVKYGEIRPMVSQLRIKTDNNIDNHDNDIIGVVELDSENPSKLIWSVDIDTLPVNTLKAIDAIIDPTVVYPSKGLPIVKIGQRYLLLESIGTPTIAWGDLVANANDIIEWDGMHWQVVFDSGANFDETHYILNRYNNKQIKWNGQFWHLVTEGVISPGYWRIFL